MKEKIYKFTQWGSITDFTEIELKESELEEKHQNVLLGELIKRYEELPDFLKPKLKELLK